MRFGNIQKDFEKIDKLLESQNKTENGQGTHTSTDGKKYNGDIENVEPNGFGMMTYPMVTYPDGRKYNGQGTFTYSDGRKYVGGWKDGFWNGHGTSNSPDGDKYVGEYKDGEEWNGKYYNKDGIILYKVKNGEIVV